MIKQRNLDPSLQTWIQRQSNLFAGVGSASTTAVQGTIWHVDYTNGSDTGFDGKSWDAPYKTIAAVIDLAQAYDQILLGPGDHPIAVPIALTTTHQNLKILGANTHRNNHSVLVYPSAAIHLLTLADAVHNVEIAGIGFVQNQNTKNAIVVGDGSGSANWKLYIHDCKFDLYGTGETAILPNDGSAMGDAPDIVIENNHFRSFATSGIIANWTRSWICYNTMFVDASKIGIDYRQTGGNRPDNICMKNKIIGSNSSDTGIKIAATEPTDGTLLVYDNCVTNCGTKNITNGKSDAGLVNNPTYADGAALAQVDPT